MADKLSRSILYKGFRKMLIAQFGETQAAEIWYRISFRCWGIWMM